MPLSAKIYELFIVLPELLLPDTMQDGTAPLGNAE